MTSQYQRYLSALASVGARQAGIQQRMQWIEGEIQTSLDTDAPACVRQLEDELTTLGLSLTRLGHEQAFYLQRLSESSPPTVEQTEDPLLLEW